VLVRSVEKGSREKGRIPCGRCGSQVNNQPVHDTSDFTHALRSSSGGCGVTVMREETRAEPDSDTLREERSGSLLEDSFDIPVLTAETQEAINAPELKSPAWLRPSLKKYRRICARKTWRRGCRIRSG